MIGKSAWQRRGMKTTINTSSENTRILAIDERWLSPRETIDPVARTKNDKVKEIIHFLTFIFILPEERVLPLFFTLSLEYLKIWHVVLK